MFSLKGNCAMQIYTTDRAQNSLRSLSESILSRSYARANVSKWPVRCYAMGLQSRPAGDPLRPFRTQNRTASCAAREEGITSRQHLGQRLRRSRSMPATRGKRGSNNACARCTQHAHTWQTPAPSPAPAHCAQPARSSQAARTCFAGPEGDRPAGCPSPPSRRLARLDEDVGLRTMNSSNS